MFIISVGCWSSDDNKGIDYAWFEMLHIHVHFYMYVTSRAVHVKVKTNIHKLTLYSIYFAALDVPL